jgi:hypothetical protein
MDDYRNIPDRLVRLSKPLFSCVALLATLAFHQITGAAEYILVESPPPESAGKLQVPIDYAFREKPLSERFLLKGLKERLKDLPPFWRDTRVDFHSRTYAFDRRNSSTDKAEAWTVGGQVEYESGRWNNLGIRAAYYFSSKLHADGGDTGLLAPGQKNISLLAEANLSYEFTNTVLKGSVVRLYRQTLTLPFVNKHDIRMLPAVHEGYTIWRENSSLDYIVGHLTQFKDYDSDDFVSMSEAAGAFGTNKGLTLAGGRISLSDDYSVGAIDYYGWDTFNTFYAEATYHKVLTENLDIRLSSQFTYQSSVGDELVGDFDTTQFGTKGAIAWQGAVVTLAGSITGDDAGIRKPWGGTPSYLSIQRFTFDRANEKALLLGISYNTDYFSSRGLSSFINIAHGFYAKTSSTGADLPERTEYDITVDYKPPDGFLEGLWVRARFNYVDMEDSSDTVRDFRIIVNYTLTLL